VTVLGIAPLLATAPLLAAVAAGAGVLAAWDCIVIVEEAAPARALGRALAPLRLAGRRGREPTAAERRRLALLGACALLVGGWLVAGPVAGAVAAAAGPALVARVVAARRRRWRRRLADGVPVLARALADALAAGRSIRGGLAEVAQSGAVPGPAGAEVADAAGRLALGAPTEAVLEGLRARAADPAWDTFVAAVLLQRDAGGDLALLLRNVAAAQEEARRAEADARGVTAQARATARLVAGLPFAGLALAELAHPGTLAGLLGDPRARWPALGAFALGALALAVVGRLGRVGEA
jgi:tight adherence protein B